MNGTHAEDRGDGRPSLATQGVSPGIRRLLERGRAGAPVVVPTRPGPGGDAEAVSMGGTLDGEGFHRLWASALFYRMLDAFEASAVLWAAGHEIEAAAHSRIGFEHLVHFAWVIADPEDVSRPARIARHGLAFVEKQHAELGRSEWQMSEVWLAICPDAGEQLPPPMIQKLCGVLDEQLPGRVPGVSRDFDQPFTQWYSHYYRGASGLVHPGPAGIAWLIEQQPDAFVVAPFDQKGLLSSGVADQIHAALLIARSLAPWLGVTPASS